MSQLLSGEKCVCSPYARCLWHWYHEDRTDEIQKRSRPRKVRSQRKRGRGE